MVDPLEVERLTIGGGIKEITNVHLVGLKFCYNLSEILGPLGLLPRSAVQPSRSCPINSVPC